MPTGAPSRSPCRWGQGFPVRLYRVGRAVLDAHELNAILRQTLTSRSPLLPLRAVECRSTTRGSTQSLRAARSGDTPCIKIIDPAIGILVLHVDEPLGCPLFRKLGCSGVDRGIDLGDAHEASSLTNTAPDLLLLASMPWPNAVATSSSRSALMAVVALLCFFAAM